MNHTTTVECPWEDPYKGVTNGSSKSSGRARRIRSALEIITALLVLVPFGPLAMIGLVVGMTGIGKILVGDGNLQHLGGLLIFFGGPAGLVGIYLFIAEKRRIVANALLTWGLFSYGFLIFPGVLTGEDAITSSVGALVMLIAFVVALADLVFNMTVDTSDPADTW